MLLGTVGEGFGDLEDRAHSHTTDIGNVTSTSTSVAHTHGVGAHSTGSSGSHNHQWKEGLAGTFNAAGASSPGSPFGFAAGSIEMAIWGSTDRFTDNDGAHTRQRREPNDRRRQQHRPYSRVQPAGHSVDILLYGAGHAVYLQLLACRRD